MLTMLVLSHIGLALLAIGFLALLVSAARERWWWGLLAVLPPGQWLFVLLHKGKGWKPLLAQLLGVAMIILPAMDMLSDPVLATHYVNKRYSLQCCDITQPLVVAEPLPVDPANPPITPEHLLTPEKQAAIEQAVREQVRQEQAAAVPVTPPPPPPPAPEPAKPIFHCKDANGHTVFTDQPCDQHAPQ